jgi:Phosphotransferase enzyme family
MLEIFRETLPQALQQEFLVEDCQIELVSYRRRQRCVLRYRITSQATDSGEIRRQTVYGKVAAHRNQTFNNRLIDSLRDRIVPQGARRFAIPRSLGWLPDLQLSLLEAIPGEEQVGAALRARLRGHSRQGVLSLEEMVATCGYVAATLHTSGLQCGHARSLDDEIGGLRQEIAVTRQFMPELSDRAQSWLDHIVRTAERSEPLPLRLCHGDFKYEQVLFDGTSSGLVDFDTMCQAEPALDIGKFLAHLTLQARKMQKRAAASPSLAEELVEQFLCAYLRAAGAQLDDEQQLRRRTTLYETIALLRMALRSPQKFYEGRLEITTALLEERLS